MKRKIVIKPIAMAVALSFAGGASAVGTGTVVAGTRSISKEGNNTIVNQNTDKMVINWNNMDVGKSESLNFKQPDVNSAVLNKISSLDPTVIAGALKANGKVFVVNPNGVLISKGATVNVGSLIASALDISTEDFYKGNFNFKGDGKGKVSNEGDITADGSVAMIGAGEVSNNGTIRSARGNVDLAAGGDITLQFPAFGKMSVKINKGSLNALISNGGLMVTQQGTLTLSSWATDTLTRGVINNTGVLEARGFNSTKSGDIILSSLGSGDVNVGGQMRGLNMVAASGENVNVNDGTSISSTLTGFASTKENGAVQLGKMTSHRGVTVISADNVLTTAAGRESFFAGDVTVTARTEGNSIALADNTVTDRSQIQKGKGVINAGLVESVARSGSQLTVNNAKGDINVNNAQQDYGNLVLKSDRNININSQMQGNDLYAEGDSINQAAGASIAMRNGVHLNSQSDLTQNSHISASNISLNSNKKITQSKESTNTAVSISYAGSDLELNGATDGRMVQLSAINGATQGTDASIRARNLDISGGNVNLLAGKNSIREINVNADSLALTNTGDTRFTPFSSVNGDLNLNVDKNVSLSELNVGGKANISAGEDINIRGALRSGDDMTLSAKNILAPTRGYYDNVLEVGNSLTLNAQNRIALDRVSFVNGAPWGSQPPIGGNNSFTAAAKDISLNEVYGANKTSLRASADAMGNLGNIRLGSSTLFGDVNVFADGNVMLTGNMNTSGRATIEANNIIGSYMQPNCPWSPSERVGIEASGIALFAKNNVNLGRVSAQTDYSGSTDGSVSLNAKNDVNIASMHASDSVNLLVGGQLNIGDLAIDGYYPDPTLQPASAIMAGKNVNIGAATVTGDIGISASGTINYNNVGGTSDLSLTSDNGSINLSNNANGWWGSTGDYKNLTLKAAQRVSMTGDMFVNGDLSVTAGKPGIFLPSYLRVTGNATLTTPGNITTSNNRGGWYTFDHDLTYVVSNASKIGNRYGRPLNTEVYGNETKIVK